MTEGHYQESIEFITSRLDPNGMFKILCSLIKRLYIKTKWNTEEMVANWEKKLRKNGQLVEKESKVDHYIKQELNSDLEVDDGAQNVTASEDISLQKTGGLGSRGSKRDLALNPNHVPKSLTHKDKNVSRSKKSIGRPRGTSFDGKKVGMAPERMKMQTKGDLNNISMDDDNYNIFLHANDRILNYLDQDFKISSFEDLKSHYLYNHEFGQHPCMEFIMKIYAFIKTLEYNQKFKGYMRKRIEDMKKHYSSLPSVGALCSNEELEMYKKLRSQRIAIPEDVTIFCFIADVCQPVEIVNSIGKHTFAYFPMPPKVYFLTTKSINSFRAECRIDQSTTKVMDLMSYVEQFEIEMDINLNLTEKYNMMSKILSGDAFAFYKKFLWVMGFLINILVCGYYEIVPIPGISAEKTNLNDFKINNQRIYDIVFILSMIQFSLAGVIIIFWFGFRYNAIRRIEREKFMIKDPGMDPDTTKNWIQICIFASIIYQDAALNFILHFFFVILSYKVDPVFFGLHLLLIINIMQTAKYVVKSITYRFPQ